MTTAAKHLIETGSTLARYRLIVEVTSKWGVEQRYHLTATGTRPAAEREALRRARDLWARPNAAVTFTVVDLWVLGR